jgi:hypothetical protein
MKLSSGVIDFVAKRRRRACLWIRDSRFEIKGSIRFELLCFESTAMIRVASVYGAFAISNLESIDMPGSVAALESL